MKETTKKALKEHGFLTITDYLLDLSEFYNVDFDIVSSIFDTLGESELFDGVVSMVQDAEQMFGNSYR